MFSQESLVSHEDTVVVAAAKAYPMYRRTAAYVCQPGRAFRDGVAFMGFYHGGAIQPEIAKIRHRRDNVVFEEGTAERLEEGKEEDRDKIGELISRLLDSGECVDGEPYQVFLLSPSDDPDTLRLPRGIRNTKTDRNGKPWAWTMSQAYTRISALRQGPETTTELEKLGG